MASSVDCAFLCSNHFGGWPMLGSDRPISNLPDDLFGYGDLARAVATGIVDRKNLADGFVIGIDAAWGMVVRGMGRLLAPVNAT